MFNAAIPAREELPTLKQLHRSSFVAACIAVLLYFTAYLPAEYGVDPTGFGAVTGLTEMGEIKMQLLKESHPGSDQSSSVAPVRDVPSTPWAFRLSGLFIGSAEAHESGHGAAKSAHQKMHEADQVKTAGRKDKMSLVLKPGQGAEIKLKMKKGGKAKYFWTVNGGTANFDMHGDGPGGKEKSYKRGRSVGGDEGVLEAAFPGNHGWFWRNRTKKSVTVKLWVNGEYTAIKRLM